MNNLSVIIITYNEEKNISACLQSVDWADEIIIVDANSTDNTVKICEKFTNKIFKRTWPGFAKQKSFALSNCSYPWVLSVDADERVRPELKTEIISTLETPCYDGYKIARRSYFMGKWIKHCGWYPGYQVRLFNRDKTHLSNKRVHEGFIVKGNIGTLQHDLDHYSHPDIHTSIEKLNTYTTLEAIDRVENKTVYSYDFLTHFVSAFWNKYVARKGFLDGISGFLLSWISAFLKMVLYMKIYHFQHMKTSELDYYREHVV